MNPAQILSQNLNLNIGQIPVSTSMLQAGLIVFLLFLLILSLAQFRRHLLDWSIKGAIFGIFFGFLLALFVEGFLIIGGKTAITELLGWKNAPQPILSLLDSGRAKLVDVLGVSTTQITSSTAKEKSSVDKVIEGFQSLSPKDAKKAKSLICRP